MHSLSSACPSVRCDLCHASFDFHIFVLCEVRIQKGRLRLLITEVCFHPADQSSVFCEGWIVCLFIQTDNLSLVGQKIKKNKINTCGYWCKRRILTKKKI